MHTAQQHLHIDLGAYTPRGRAVRIDNKRPLQAMRLLEGRTANQALQLLPLLFGLCGRAQDAAARDALQHALPPSSAAQRHALHRRVQIETVREHLLQIHRDWPALSNAPPSATDLGQIMALTDAASTDAGTLAPLIDWVSRHTLGLPPARFLAFRDTDSLRHWARATAAVAPRGLWSFYGAATTLPAIVLPSLESLAPGQLLGHIAADAALEFVRQPTHAGACLETGPATRRRDHPLVQATAAHGLLARFAARLVDLCATLVILQRNDIPTPAPEVPGLGWVDSARGRLIHHAELDAQQRIARYRILAPTEWNAHPQGLAAQLLANIARHDSATTRQLAKLVLLAIDPCVQATLHLATPQPEPEPAHA